MRLRVGVAIVVLQWLVRFGVPQVLPDQMAVGVMGGLAGGVLVLIWWTFFSGFSWRERLAGVGLVVAGMAGAWGIADISIAAGAMGMLFPILAVPTVSLALVLWAVFGRGRMALLAGAVMVGCGMWTVVRTEGFTSNFDNQLLWRWARTAEERLVAAPPVVEEVAAPAVPAAAAAPVVAAPVTYSTGSGWAGFRGAERDGVARGSMKDWAPTALWRKPVGPGWSSFAVAGDLIYTQEQRGEEEMVSCYRVATGGLVWRHSDRARFWESNAGPGPRGTPTLDGGRVYTFGGTGIVNALDAATGEVIWTRDAAADTGAERPEWGFASSPLVAGVTVVVAASGTLVGYDVASGAVKWVGKAGGASYSSPRLVTLQGVEQVLLVSGVGVRGVAVADGALLWEHLWKGYPIVQPGVTEDGDFLVAVSDSSGIRRLSVGYSENGWTVAEKWTSKGLKPYFNDFVVHKGHAYGFDGSILSCIDLTDGTRKWKGGRYGQGQMVLLADQDLLLVLAESGEIAMVRATPDGYAEVSRRPGVEGKTWNHPVVAGEILLVRNGEEMAAFRLLK